MKDVALGDLTVQELVERFSDIGRAQDKALLREQIAEFKKLYQQMSDVDQELRSRGLQARLALTRLFDDPNLQVRLQAARKSLAVAPEAARAVIEAIYESRRYPQAGDAGMTLWNLEKGVFKPD